MSVQNLSNKLELNNSSKSPHDIWFYENNEIEVNPGKEDCTAQTITRVPSKLSCNTHKRVISTHTESTIIHCDPHEDLYEPLDYRIDWSVELKQQFSRDLQRFYLH